MAEPITPSNNLPDALRAAAASAHTPESFGRSLISEALRMRARQETEQSVGPLEATITVGEVDRAATESTSSHDLFTVCVMTSDHIYCVHVQPPFQFHIA